MAKKDNQSARTSLDEFNDQLTSIEQKVENNKKIITYVVGGIVALILLGAGFYYGYYKPNQEDAKKAIAKADTERMMQQDSLALKDYEKVARNYSNEYGNRAKLNAAILLYEQGKYKEALNYLEDYDPKGRLVGPNSQSLLGDCYVNLKKYDDALKAFDRAIKLSGDNPQLTPVFMVKKAVVLRELKKYADELELYTTIKTKYPNFADGMQIEKYIERAQAQAGK